MADQVDAAEGGMGFTGTGAGSETDTTGTTFAGARELVGAGGLATEGEVCCT
jgi:hypothetical protein